VIGGPSALSAQADGVGCQTTWSPSCPEAPGASARFTCPWPDDPVLPQDASRHVRVGVRPLQWWQAAGLDLHHLAQVAPPTPDPGHPGRPSALDLYELAGDISRAHLAPTGEPSQVWGRSMRPTPPVGPGRSSSAAWAHYPHGARGHQGRAAPPAPAPRRPPSDATARSCGPSARRCHGPMRERPVGQQAALLLGQERMSVVPGSVGRRLGQPGSHRVQQLELVAGEPQRRSGQVLL
jgi:hypothetical protein